jgi:protein-S-isoprenylcysteine O-methyltransferase Ste14
MCFGTALAFNRLAALASLLFFFIGFLIKLKQEERLLARHFPDEYPAYKARTRMLVPFVL